MTGDCHVRFCERLRGETPLCLLGGKLFNQCRGYGKEEMGKSTNTPTPNFNEKYSVVGVHV
jgi:hypothetical protein